MSWFIEHLKTLADKPAIVDAQGAFSYADLSNQIQAYKNALDKTLPDGQLVAILSDYNFYAVALFFALLQKKAIIVPIVTCKQDEVGKRLQVVACNWVIRLEEKTLSVSYYTAANAAH